MAEYNLSDVRQLAKNKKIEYRGRKVQRDIANLNYEFKDVLDCLCSLTECDFKKSHYYDDPIPPDDEYICHYQRKGLNDEEECEDELYVKFCLTEDCLMLDLGSFHLPKY